MSFHESISRGGTVVAFLAGSAGGLIGVANPGPMARAGPPPAVGAEANPGPPPAVGAEANPGQVATRVTDPAVAMCLVTAATALISALGAKLWPPFESWIALEKYKIDQASRVERHDLINRVDGLEWEKKNLKAEVAELKAIVFRNAARITMLADNADHPAPVATEATANEATPP